jgi:hypothetical protein
VRCRRIQARTGRPLLPGAAAGEPGLAAAGASGAGPGGYAKDLSALAPVSGDSSPGIFPPWRSGHIQPPHFRANFNAGLEIMLDGVERALAAKRARTGVGPRPNGRR